MFTLIVSPHMAASKEAAVSEPTIIMQIPRSVMRHFPPALSRRRTLFSAFLGSLLHLPKRCDSTPLPIRHAPQVTNAYQTNSPQNHWREGAQAEKFDGCSFPRSLWPSLHRSRRPSRLIPWDLQAWNPALLLGQPQSLARGPRK